MCLVLSTAALAGCSGDGGDPPGNGGGNGTSGNDAPVIVLSESSLSISSRSGKAAFWVTNDGQGTLTWEATTPESWLSLSGAVNDSATAGQSKEIAVTLHSPPDGISTGVVLVKSSAGDGSVTVTAELDEAPVVDVWFTSESGERLGQLCVGDRVYMVARATDPDSVTSVMGAVAWADSTIPLHNMAKSSSDTWRLGTFDILQTAEWIFTVRGQDSGGHERQVRVAISIGRAQPDGRVCTPIHWSQYKITPRP